MSVEQSRTSLETGNLMSSDQDGGNSNGIQENPYASYKPFSQLSKKSPADQSPGQSQPNNQQQQFPPQASLPSSQNNSGFPSNEVDNKFNTPPPNFDTGLQKSEQMMNLIGNFDSNQNIPSFNQIPNSNESGNFMQPNKLFNSNTSSPSNNMLNMPVSPNDVLFPPPTQHMSTQFPPLNHHQNQQPPAVAQNPSNAMMMNSAPPLFQSMPPGQVPGIPPMPFPPAMLDPSMSAFMPPFMPGVMGMPMIPSPLPNAANPPIVPEVPSAPFSNIDFNEEVWMHAFSGDDKVYYIEVKSEKTQWDEPLNVKNPIQDHKDFVAIKEAYLSWLEKNPKAKAPKKPQETKSTNAKSSKIFIPSEVVEWSTHYSNDNEVYYYNSRTKKSVWDKPQVLIQWEESQKKGANSSLPPSASPAPTSTNNNSKNGSSHQNSGDSKNNEKPQNSKTNSSTNAESGSSKKSAKEWIAIPNSQWLMVLQNAGKIFYYNKEEKISQYAVPEMIKERNDLKDLAKRLEEQAAKKSQGAPAPEPKVAKTSGNDNEIEKIINKYKTMPLEERKKIYMGLLADKKVSAFSTWKNELHKIVNDDRYLCLDSSERKDVFNQYCKVHAAAEKEEKHQMMQKVKNNFIELLKESQVGQKTSFIEFSNKFGKDNRFRAIDKKKERENLFDDYQAMLKKQHHEKQLLKGKLKEEFFALLETVKSQIIKEQLSYKQVRKLVVDDPRFAAVTSKADRHAYYDEYMELIRQNRSIGTNSLKEREIEVAKSIEKVAHQRDRSKTAASENGAKETLKAILIDYCKDPNVEWTDVKRKICSDQRWENCTTMKRRVRDEIFENHLQMLLKKSSNALCEIFDDLDLNVDSKWSDDLKNKARKHSKFMKVSNPSSKYLEKEFNSYMKQKKRTALVEFKLLLKETKLINNKTNSQLEENPNLFRDIIKVLESDKRYHNMGKTMKEERRNALLSYIEKLEKQGSQT